MKIRRGVRADLGQAILAGPHFHEEAPRAYRQMPFSPLRLEASLNDMIATGIFLVAERDDGKLVGFVGAARGTAFFSDAPLSLECFWYVYPGYRGSLVAPRLFAALKKAAKGTMLILLTLEGENARGLRNFYERQGCELFEQAYFLQL